MAGINVDVKQRGLRSAYIAAPFDEGIEALAREGYRVISLEENAQLRIQNGADAFVSRNGNWTREGVLYVPRKGTFLTKKSPIMANAREAANCHRNGQDFYLTGEQVEEVLSDSVGLSGTLIPTDRFKENEITAYAFGEYAEAYGQFLKQAGIYEMPLYLTDTRKKPFVRQIWFTRFGAEASVLDGINKALYCNAMVRGIHMD